MYKLTIRQPMEAAPDLRETVGFKSDKLSRIMSIIELMCDTWHDARTTFTIEEVEPEEDETE